MWTEGCLENKNIDFKASMAAIEAIGGPRDTKSGFVLCVDRPSCCTRCLGVFHFSIQNNCHRCFLFVWLLHNGRYLTPLLVVLASAVHLAKEPTPAEPAAAQAHVAAIQARAVAFAE